LPENRAEAVRYHIRAATLSLARINARRREKVFAEQNIDSHKLNMRDKIRFLNKEQLRRRLNLPSTRSVDELIRNKRVPVLRLGHRTVRFDWPKVEAALGRLEAKEAGR
jgi:hypothetical protein